jgi:hypothetical protein
MRNNKWVGFVAGAGLAVGLLTLGNASSPGQVPAAKAGVVWEYKTHFGPTGQDADEVLNGAGREGWELVAIGDDSRNLVRYVFKRPKQK